MRASSSRLPENGLGRESVLDLMNRINDQEAGKWKDWLVSGAVYHGDEQHIVFLNRVYGMAATIPFRGLVGDMLKQYIDLLYKVK